MTSVRLGRHHTVGNAAADCYCKRRAELGKQCGQASDPRLLAWRIVRVTSGERSPPVSRAGASKCHGDPQRAVRSLHRSAVIIIRRRRLRGGDRNTGRSVARIAHLKIDVGLPYWDKQSGDGRRDRFRRFTHSQRREADWTTRGGAYRQERLLCPPFLVLVVRRTPPAAGSLSFHRGSPEPSHRMRKCPTIFCSAA